jgi:sugar lactone lactonase YvrE
MIAVALGLRAGADPAHRTADLAMEQTMKSLLSALSRYLRFPQRTRCRKATAPARTGRTRQRTRLFLEALEDRTVPTAVALPSNAVSWWTANNTANDALGLNNATLTGVTYATGEVGQAFSFDGSDDRAQIVDNPTLQFTTSLSIEGWVFVKGFPTGTNGDDHGEILFRGDDRGGLDPYSLSVEPNGTLNFQVTNASNQGSSIAAPIATNQWVHVAGALDDATGTMSLYENGAVVAQEVTSIRPFANLDPTQNPSIALGNHGGYPSSPHNFPFNGLIDELAVYNRALTSGEVFGIYKAGSSGKVISPIAVSDPSVVDGADGATTPVTFTIARTGSLSGSLTVNWATADDTAVAGTDYVAASGSVTFADGQATQTVTVTTLDNNNLNPNLDFKLIATPAGGTSVMGLATILSDDASIAVSSTSAIEGGNTLKFLDHFVSPGSGGLARARSSVFGPDGNLYVVSADTNAVLRYDSTGEFINALVPSGSGGLSNPWDLAFAPDGSLYVSSMNNNEVLRYDGSGNFLGVVASGFSAVAGVTVGPDGNLYIADQGANEVFRYNSSSGLSTFIAAGSGGLSQPRNAVFGPDGNLFVASQGTGQVLRYNGQTGDFMGVFATSPSTPGPIWLEFGTDGYLYATARTTSSGSNTSILRFNATTSAYVDSFALGRDGWSFNLGPGNIVYDSSNSAGGFVDRIGPSSIAAFTVSLAWPSAGTTTVSYATADGTALAGTHYTTTSGTLTFAPGETSKGILVSTLDDGVADPTRAFTVTLSNPVGGSITSSQGIGTILDDTKFYVVDGGSSDSTYQYAVGGGALGNSALGSGDTAPRGVATTAAGTTAWVVDANKTVYVYNTAGALLGSWSASGLSSSATLTGIATDGTNIWLVDSYSDKVYEYSGAASRASGSQSPASSFSLANSGKNRDSNPQDIVTDGTSFWVVDGTALKVFKYTLSGSLLGSWSIDPANAHPTGITINPSNVSDIWIVDNGTLKVYRYTAAAGRTSGSQNAAATFALNPGDTNPQGIADPPPADSHVIPFKVSGGGIAAEGLPLQLDQPAPHNATGTATELGTYTAQGMFQLTSFTSPTSGTFDSAVPVVFVAANGDQIAFTYAGTFQLFAAGHREVYAVFTATFTPVPQDSTGRFANVTGGSVTMVATSDAFVLGATDPVGYTWVGDGWLAFRSGHR